MKEDVKVGDGLVQKDDAFVVGQSKGKPAAAVGYGSYEPEKTQIESDYKSPLARFSTQGRRSEPFPFKEGFDDRPYHFAWLSTEGINQYRDYGFTPCTKQAHSGWFGEGVWDERGNIGRGHLNNGQPEQILCVRPVAYLHADQKAVIANSEAMMGKDVRELEEKVQDIPDVTVKNSTERGWGNTMKGNN